MIRVRVGVMFNVSIYHRSKCRTFRLLFLSIEIMQSMYGTIQGGPEITEQSTGRYSRFSGLCSNQQLFSSPCWIEHLFPIIITPRSSNLVENCLFYETFLMDCHFRDLPDFQSFEAR